MTISNLTELLEQSNCHYCCYDLGGRVQALTTAEFVAVTEQRAPYPYPQQHHAQFALVFWPQLQAQPEPFMWLLKLPIDERGLLDQQAQQSFITQVVALLGQQLTGALSAQQQQQLQHSQYLFTPSTVQQAALHAQLRLRFAQPPSLHFEAVESYLRNPHQQPWQQLGLQGIHDVAVRLTQLESLQPYLLTQLDSLPMPFLQALAQALEHPLLPLPVVAPLLAQLPQLTAERQLLVWRMLSSRADHAILQQELLQRLQGALTTNHDIDLLVLVAMRLWPALIPAAVTGQGEEQQPNLLAHYLQHLAALEHTELRVALLQHLIRVPAVRPHLLALLRRHDNTTPLRQLWQQLNETAACN